MREPPSTSRPSTVHVAEAEQLTEYVREGGVPASAGTSNFGAMLERMSVMGYAMVRCPVCRARQATRRRRRKRAAERRARGELGAADLVLGRPPQALQDEEWFIAAGCDVCNGTGRVLRRITAAMHHNPEITAHETGSSVKGKPPATMGSADELERMGRVGNLLAQLRERDPEGAEALEIWRAPGGRKLLLLMHLTPAGRDSYDLHGGKYASARDWLLAEARRRKAGYRDHVRDRLFERSQTEARLLIETAAATWNELIRALDESRSDRYRAAAVCQAAKQLRSVR